MPSLLLAGTIISQECCAPDLGDLDLHIPSPSWAEHIGWHKGKRNPKEIDPEGNVSLLGTGRQYSAEYNPNKNRLYTCPLFRNKPKPQPESLGFGIRNWEVRCVEDSQLLPSQELLSSAKPDLQCTVFGHTETLLKHSLSQGEWMEFSPVTSHESRGKNPVGRLPFWRCGHCLCSTARAASHAQGSPDSWRAGFWQDYFFRRACQANPTETIWWHRKSRSLTGRQSGIP